MQITDVTPSLNNGLISLLEEGFLIIAIIGILLYIMTRRSRLFRAIDLSNMRISPIQISLILLLIAILCPAYLSIYPISVTDFEFNIFSMSWQIGQFNPINIQFGLYSLLVGLVFMFVKFIFIYQVFKYYYGETTQTRVIIFGLIGELQLMLFTMVMLPFVTATPGVSMAFPIPLPILLFSGFLILNVIPIPLPLEDWEELERFEDWWEKED